MLYCHGNLMYMHCHWNQFGRSGRTFFTNFETNYGIKLNKPLKKNVLNCDKLYSYNLIKSCCKTRTDILKAPATCLGNTLTKFIFALCNPPKKS